jgi:hypothetical protein
VLPGQETSSEADNIAIAGPMENSSNALVTVRCKVAGEVTESWEKVRLSGSGFVGTSLAGFCAESRSFVRLSWAHGKEAPSPLRIWVPELAREVALYSFPDCDQPLVPIDRPSELRGLPGCEETEVVVVGNWD